MNRNYILLFLVLLLFNARSQDPYFSNNNRALLNLSPSFAGNNGFMRIQNVYRVQDFNNKVSFKTAYSAVDAYIRPVQGGVGLSYLSDEQAKGKVKSRSVGFAYSQHIFLFKKRIKVIPAFQGVYTSKTLDLSAIKAGDTVEFRKYYTAEVAPSTTLNPTRT